MKFYTIHKILHKIGFSISVGMYKYFLIDVIKILNTFIFYEIYVVSVLIECLQMDLGVQTYI